MRIAECRCGNRSYQESLVVDTCPACGARTVRWLKGLILLVAIIFGAFFGDWIAGLLR